jgi:hypothetical protein
MLMALFDKSRRGANLQSDYRWGTCGARNAAMLLNGVQNAKGDDIDA